MDVLIQIFADLSEKCAIPCAKQLYTLFVHKQCVDKRIFIALFRILF